MSWQVFGQLAATFALFFFSVGLPVFFSARDYDDFEAFVFSAMFGAGAGLFALLGIGFWSVIR